ncbi:hypothetical protein CWB96_06230 [Pseudoalteromonas citrea]|uniref:Uncharacterized protein n=1 Tax=Pseudoalteromonas citrea TaxID=43655 RepID=A0A5S3XSL2_9GAMM|nr:hypothetical protein [Pseudoalteromonas citrea]TMP41786.1 hypothetical protein CWB97_13540 [Pseudoalteromonas citrea]TMP60563.1 hypothetical protein CWB96_06230 [Pseudoalteromonas citrea]
MMKPTRLTRVMCACVTIVLLTGCFKEGEIRGSNELLLNGSLLKGTMAHADIYIEDIDHHVIWQGASDENGQFQSQFSALENSIYTLRSKVNHSTIMQCDAVFCFDTNDNVIAQFGEPIIASEIAGLQLTSFISSHAQTQTHQLNAFTTLVHDLVAAQLLDGVYLNGVEKVSVSASNLVSYALNLPIDSGNFLSKPLQNLAIADEEIDAMSIVNAAMSAHISYLPTLSATIVAAYHEPNNHQLQSALEAQKNQILDTAYELLASAYVANVSQQVANQISVARQRRIDFAAFALQSHQLRSDISMTNAQRNITGAFGRSGN